MNQNNKHHPIKKTQEPTYMKPILWIGCTIILIYYLGQLPQHSGPNNIQEGGTTEVDTMANFAEKLLEGYRKEKAGTKEDFPEDHSWTVSEVDAFIDGCENTSLGNGLNDIGITSYCECTLNETTTYYPENPPGVDQWTDERLLQASAMCSAKVLDNPLVEYSPTDEHSLNYLVDLFIEYDYYQPALNMLYNLKSVSSVNRLLEKTHLNYGLHSINKFDAEEMEIRMNIALAQFTEVLRINPQNKVATEQIEQIMGVYGTIPDRRPNSRVLEGLRELGFDEWLKPAEER